ncbi:hypothetical protein ACFWM3_07655 [Gottfriedia sp. NPDC058432]|uniref:hypothetical protein n=1 Tax=Gottfriedia sp. NPDC058432 TaxID=3346497 RepID=UPI003647947C
MLSIKTYVHKNGEWYGELEKPTDYTKHFIEFREFNKEKLQFLSGRERLYGFVDIQFNTTSIIDSTYFGTLTDMWLVYVQLIQAFYLTGEGNECYPDYECYLSIKKNVNNGITLKIGNQINDYDIEPTYFCKEFIKGAKVFYESYPVITNLDGYQEYIEEVINPLFKRI